MLIGSIHVAADFAQFNILSSSYEFNISSYMKPLKAFLKSDFLVYVEVEIQ